jgi:DNA (cytosine-5)-methyltransferase 1
VDIHTVISAFSGIGGLDIGVGNAIRTRTIAYIERETSCARVLAARASQGLLDEAPIFSDIKQFPAEIFAGKTHGFIGGFPCQPWSVSGKGEGEFDEKGRNLWPQTIGLIRALQPEWVFLENVSNLIVHKYFGRILGDLAESGFDIEYDCFTAAQAGAPHRRERIFILAFNPQFRSEFDDVQMADNEHQRSNRSESQGRPRRQTGIFKGRGVELADGDGCKSFRCSGETKRIEAARPILYGVWEFPPGPDDPAWGDVLRAYPELAPATCKHEPQTRPQMYEAEPAVRRMADAGQVEDRVASLMALGNAVVPHQAELAFRTLASRI